MNKERTINILQWSIIILSILGLIYFNSQPQPKQHKNTSFGGITDSLRHLNEKDGVYVHSTNLEALNAIDSLVIIETYSPAFIGKQVYRLYNGEYVIKYNDTIVCYIDEDVLSLVFDAPQNK